MATKPPWDAPEDEMPHFSGCLHTDEGKREWRERHGDDPLPDCICMGIAEDLAADYAYDSRREER